MISLPNGALVAIASSYGAEKTITDISNSNPAVAALAAGHGVGSGDILEMTSGWSRLSDKVVAAGGPSGDDIPLLGIDTSSAAIYPAGSGGGHLREILDWVQLTQILTSTSSGGEQQFTEYQLLEDDARHRIPTAKNPSGLSFSIADDPTLPGYQLVSDANDDRLPRAIRITLPTGALIFYNAYVSLNRTPSLTVNEIMACEVTLSLLAEPVRYAAGEVTTTPPVPSVPTLSAPTVVSITTTGGAPRVSVNKAADLAMVVVPDGSGQPTATQIKTGKQASGATALASGTHTMSGSGTWTFTLVTGLSVGTQYDVYFIGTNSVGDSAIVLAEFSTSATLGAPILSSPTVASVTSDGGSPSVATNVPATLWYVAVPNGSGTPTPTQIKAGQQSSGAAALASQSHVMSGAGTWTFTAITGLTSGTDYDVYFVGNNGVGDSTVVLAEFTTTGGSLVAPSIGFVDVLSITADGGTPQMGVNKAATDYFVWVPDGDGTDAAHIKLGQQQSGAPALASGSAVVGAAGVHTFPPVTGMSSGTNFDVRFVATNGAGDSIVAHFDVLTSGSSTPILIVGTPLWTDNGDGTATLTFETDVATYAGIDYGAVSTIYTASSFDYGSTPPTLALTTLHTIEVPDPSYGTGTEAAGTYFYRIYAALSGDPTGAYIDIERSGAITSGGGAFAPDDVAGLWAYCKKATGITGDPDVSLWADQGGVHSFSGTGGATMPQLQAADTVLMNGINAFLNNGTTLNQPCSFVVKYRNVTALDNVAVLGGQGNTTSMVVAAGGASVKLYAGSAFVCDNFEASAVGSYMVVVAVFNGASSYIRVNNGAKTIGDPGSAGMTGVDIGACLGIGTFANIEVEQFAIYSTAISDADADALVTFMSDAFTPADVPGLWAYCAKATGIVGDPNVSLWSDLSVAGRNFSSGGGTSPQLQSDDTVILNGINSFLYNPTMLNQPCTLVIKYKNLAAIDNTAVFGGFGNNTSLLGNAGGAVGRLYAGGGFVADNGDIAAVGVYMVAVLVFNGSASYIRVNNGTKTTGNPGSVGLDGVCIGTSVGIGSYSNIQVEQFAIYDNEISDADADALVAFMT